MNCNLVYNSLFTVYNSLFGPNSASSRPNVVVSFHKWTTCGPRQLHIEFGPNIRQTSIPAVPLSFMFLRFAIQNFRLQFDPRPPPFCGPLNKIDNRYDTILSFRWWTNKCPRNLVQIFKGLVTLYAFSPFQFIIRHTPAPCLIKPVLEQTWKSPFTCGLLVVQGKCTPNLDQIFAQLLFQRDHFHSCFLVSPFKITFCNSTYPPPFRSPFNKTDNGNNTIFFF